MLEIGGQNVECKICYTRARIKSATKLRQKLFCNWIQQLISTLNSFTNAHIFTINKLRAKKKRKKIKRDTLDYTSCDTHTSI